MRVTLAGVVVFAAWALFACNVPATGQDDSIAGNTEAICADWDVVLKRYSLGNAPELLAYRKALEDAYQGHGDPAAQRAAQVALDQAWARDLRPIAERATDADLKAALRAQVRYYENRAAGKALSVEESKDFLRQLKEICVPLEATPSPT